jgi:3-oxoacyl-[acyl-carrier protein] reductase
MTDLKGQLAIVSGGARDIGQAVVIELARRGADVAFTHNATDPAQTLAAVEKLDRKAIAKRVDALDGAGALRFVDWACEQFNRRISIVVNVAGGLVARRKMEEMDEDFWDRVINLNLKSAFLLTKAALPKMLDSGAIVSFSSQAARDGGGPGAIAYSTSKGAIVSFTRALAKELGPRRIRVNAVCPGMTRTTFHDTFTKPEVRQKVAAMTPLGREGESAEVARLVAFLASEEASYINGTSIDINGGVVFS